MNPIKEMEAEKTSSVFEEIEAMGHEQLVFCHDQATGLKAIVGIHNTTLGPALGGTRLWNYASEAEAVTDVLRLSRGMTFKAAISGLNLGGGKAVIIGQPSQKTEPYMRRFGRFIDSLGGRYITAEDVNIKTRDIEYVAMETTHVTGKPDFLGGGGDPSPVTAYGTYTGMKAAAKKAWGSDSLQGKQVLVQGVGQVGMYLVDHLTKEGAKVLIADIDEQKLKMVSERSGATVVSNDGLYDLDMDIYAPCALGATLNDDTISRLKCSIVAGAANNQLKEEQKHGRMLQEQGIIYAPDFLINAGGLINVYLEHLGEYNRDRAYSMADKIYDTCTNILNKSEQDKITSHEAALEIALKRIDDMGRVKLPY